MLTRSLVRHALALAALACLTAPSIHAQTIYNGTLYRIGGDPVGSSYFSNVTTTVDKISFSLNTSSNLNH